MSESDSESVVTVKSLCATRWTARTSAIEAVIKDYSLLMETMAQINSTAHEYGLKAGGILSSLEKFSTLFGLKLGYTLFSAAEEVSKGLQAKDLTIQEAMSSINLASSFTGDRGQVRPLTSFMIVQLKQHSIWQYVNHKYHETEDLLQGLMLAVTLVNFLHHVTIIASCITTPVMCY